MVQTNSCSQDDDNLPAAGAAVQFSATGIAATPATRTAINGTSGQTEWALNDPVGIFMTGAATADNRQYTVSNVASGALVPYGAGNTLAFPQSGSVNFIAYYPWKNGQTLGNYPVDVSNQSNPATIDLLYSNNATGKDKSSNPVDLTFTHALAKLKMTVAAGDGFSNLLGLTAVEIQNTGTTADFKLSNGTDFSLTATGNIAARRASPVIYEAILIPGPASGSVKFTVDGNDYFWDIGTLNINFEQNTRYDYAVTVNKSGITVSSQSITAWGAGSTDEVTAVKFITGTNWSFNPATGTLTLLAGFVLNNDLSGITGFTGFTGVSLSLVKSLVIEGTMTDAQLLKLKTLNNNSNTGSLSALESITLSNQTGALPDDFFWITVSAGGVQWLKSISAPKVTELHLAAFQNCYNLASADFPKVTTIGDAAFQRCDLVSVNFPEVTTMGDYAFDNCNNLVSVKLPKVTTMKDLVFYNCGNLASIDLPKVVSVGTSVFERTALTTVTLPDIETLGNAAFKNCPNLTTVVLPKVTQILEAYEGNFFNCPNLTSVTFGSALTSIHANTFGGSTDKSKIDLHLCAAEYALASGNTWRGWIFKSIIAIP
ncbi:hypothetical protein FACS189440_00370 [Bacteroidia bacterium]|nr:hypothetical protein FACS189423_04420 [Bacteroidia bacterium]GHT45078.1 hypothetical protein FACS189440_00370 [Bacteroidia bacterium]